MASPAATLFEAPLPQVVVLAFEQIQKSDGHLLCLAPPTTSARQVEGVQTFFEKEVAPARRRPAGLPQGSKAFDEGAAWPVQARGRLESMATRVRALARSFSPPPAR
jgi:hypothetical protein